MLKSRLLTMSLLAAMASAPAFAQTTNPVDTAVDRDVTQQQRIEQGLQSGELSSGEAARLEKGEQKIDGAESRAMKDGTVSPSEAAHIQTMQNNESNRINAMEQNGVKGNPNSASSLRMQSDVQRDINQEKRIDQGVDNGSLNTKQVGKLEKGQAKVDRKEFQAGKTGHVSAVAQNRVRKAQNHQSGKIWKAKHKGHKPATGTVSNSNTTPGGTAQ